ncbi:hypothetical protein C7271_08110 [filamentous cyanobacterium CCP5]|nr:hypothetical protein C7271_08110 [filamentous cyanobacterium CCP5]
MVASPQITEIRQLLADYSFDAGNEDVNLLVAEWLQQADSNLIHQAIIEALYQGRYKVVSVGQILNLWKRRGGPLRHYTREFESIILGPSNLPDFSESPDESVTPPLPPRSQPPQDLSEPDKTADTICPFVPESPESDQYHRLQAFARSMVNP